MMSPSTYATAACAALVLFASAAHAEAISYGDLSLPVSAVEDLQNNSVALTVRGDSLVVSKEDAGRAVAMMYASSPALFSGLSVSRRDSLVQIAAAQQDIDILRAALSTLLRNDFRREPGELAAVSRAIADRPQGALALAQVLPQDTGARLRACEEIALAPARYLAQLLRAGLPCQERVMHSAAELFARGSIDEGLELLETGGPPLPQPSPRRWTVSLREAVSSAARGDTEAFSAALDTLKDSPFEPQAAQRAEVGILRELLRVSMAQKRLDVGLLIVFRCPFSDRTDLHHQVLLQALVDRPDTLERSLSEAGARSIIVEYARKDDDIRRALVSWAEAHAQQVSSMALAGELLEDIWTLRDADGRRYPALAHLMIELLRARGKEAEADLLEETSVWRTWVLLVLLAGILGTVLAVAARRRAILQCETAALGAAPAELSRGEELLREYAKLLSELHLSEDASLQDIKSSYRRAVKGLHPDLNNGAIGASSDAFLALKQRHERLMRLHRLAHAHGETSRSSRRAAAS